MGMLLPNCQIYYSSIVYDLFCHCLVHVKKVYRFHVQVRDVMCTFIIQEYLYCKKGASVSCRTILLRTFNECLNIAPGLAMSVFVMVMPRIRMQEYAQEMHCSLHPKGNWVLFERRLTCYLSLIRLQSVSGLGHHVLADLAHLIVVHRHHLQDKTSSYSTRRYLLFNSFIKHIPSRVFVEEHLHVPQFFLSRNLVFNCIFKKI